MLEKLDEVEKRYQELGELLADPKVLKDPQLLKRYAKERASLSELVETYREYKRLEGEVEENKELLLDRDERIRELARDEINTLNKRRAELKERLKLLLLPKDPRDDKNILLEIRAGAGGEEAALFAGDLLRMYLKYAERRGWKAEIMSQSLSEKEGFKEVIILLEGKGAYGRLKCESGVHRVQRVPVTEAQGRIHTSTVTVAVLPEAEEVEVDINPADLKVEVFRSSGPGGQSVNTTDSAVRITHTPTGIVVTCQDERSQHKNKAKALKVLRARLLEMRRTEQEEEIAKMRRNQVGTGERSEKIRTYNFPQNRVTDHRIGLSLHKLEEFLSGDIEEMIEALNTHYRAEALKGGAGLGETS